MNWVVLTFEHPQCLIIKKIKNDRFRKKQMQKDQNLDPVHHTHTKEGTKRKGDWIRCFNSRPSALQF